jgi:hypothetical protein
MGDDPNWLHAQHLLRAHDYPDDQPRRVVSWSYAVTDCTTRRAPPATDGAFLMRKLVRAASIEESMLWTI